MYFELSSLGKEFKKKFRVGKGIKNMELYTPLEYIFGLCVILYPINVKIAILIRHKLW